ncbi:MAG TPA: pyruvate ferredoxin oxidoreductase, partial [Nitrospirae bacterium]|nr:pyruvate ferredoxin oxidoreductase [Nitrospirota bacterium]
PIAIRQVLHAAGVPIVAANATGCLEVSTTIYPYSAWKIPWIHSAFENAAATISGVEAMYKALKRKGKIDRKIKFIAFGGDGGTYDIGLQSLSGAVERGHDFVYICYDNGAYMNTGIQRSSATPLGANTTTSPAGKIRQGKLRPRKNLTKIMAAHNIPYAAQATPAHWRDLMTKVRKALEVDGPAYIAIFAPCNRGWRTPTNNAIELCRLAADTCFWPIYEYENGKLKINYRPKEKKPVTEFLKTQGRFKHLFSPQNEALIERIQENIDREWEMLQKEESFWSEKSGE